MTIDYSADADVVGDATDAVYEAKSNKVTSLSSTSTNTVYPSGKAVVDYVEAVVGDIDDWILTDYILDSGGT